MKRIVALFLSVLFMLCLASCSDGSEAQVTANADGITSHSEEAESIGSDSTVTASTSENIICSEPTAPDGFTLDALVSARPASAEGEDITLCYEDSVYITDIIKNGKWEEGTADCLSDTLLTVGGKEYLYHSSCGTINDNKNNRSLHLTKNQIGRINDALGPLVMLIGEETGDVQLSVGIKSPVIYGENFVLTARATNNTGKTIYVTLPTSSPNMHYEIRVKIEDESGKRFVDLDTQGKEHTDEAKTFSVENGEAITQVMNIAPGYLLDGSIYPLGEKIKYFPAGTYKGTATFTWHDSFDPDTYKYGEEHRKTINFDVEVH